MIDILPVAEEVLSIIIGQIVDILKDYHIENKRIKSLENELVDSIGTILNSEKENPYYNELTQFLCNSKIIPDFTNRCINGERSFDIDARVYAVAEKWEYKLDHVQYIRSVVHKLTETIERALCSILDLSKNIQNHIILEAMSECQENIIGAICNQVKIQQHSTPNDTEERVHQDITSVIGQSKPNFDGVALIRRRIITADNKTNNASSHCLSALKPILDNKHIILLGDAGSGKTYTIFQLYDEALALDFHVIYFSLSDPSSIRVLESVENGSYNVNKKTIFLLDGYDELSELQKSLVIETISNIVKLHPSLYMVISTRGNAIDDSITNLKFVTCSIAPIEDGEIRTFLDHYSIDFDTFISQVREQDLSELYTIPFYLNELVNIWNREGKLPAKSMLMKQVVWTRIQTDSDRHSKSQVKLQQDIRVQHTMLERVALIMQCTQKQYLTSAEIRRITEPRENVLEQYGVLVSDAVGNWHFTHNIFREYFAALALVEYDFKAILAFITTPQDKSTIRFSWYNVLAFLLSECQIKDVEKFDELLNWLINHDAQALLFCEKDKVKEEVRTAVFIHIFDEHKHLNTWVNHGLFFDKHMSSFTCTPKTIQYILQELSSPIQDKQKKNLLRALANFDHLCCLDDRVVETVKNVLFDVRSSVSVQNDAIDVMVKHVRIFKSMDYAMLELFRYRKDVNLRSNILHFWQQRKCYEDFFEVVLYEYNEHANVSDEFISYQHFLSTLLERITEVNSVQLLLQYLIENKSRVFDLRKTKVIANCCLVGAASFCEDQHDPILTLLLQLIAEPFGLDNSDYDAIRQYMISTGTEEVFVERIISENPYAQSSAILGQLVCDSVIKILEKKLQTGSIHKDILKDIVYNLDINLDYRKKIAQILFVNTGDIVSTEPYSSWEEKRISACQLYVDALFDTAKYEHLIDRIISILGENVRFGMELETEHYGAFTRMNHEFELHWCWSDLKVFFRNAGNMGIRQCLRRIENWDFYRTYCVTRLIENNAQKVMLSDSQRGVVEQYVLSALQSIEFDLITVENHTIKYPSLLPCLLRAMKALNISCPQEIAKNLLSVPVYLFDDRDHYDSFPEWVLKPLDSSTITDVIVQKIKDKELNAFTAQTYIRYCIDYKITECKQSIVDFVLDPQLHCGYYSYGIEYISKVFGEKELIETIVPYCSEEEVLLCVASYISENTVSKELDNKLWEFYCVNKKMSILQKLIIRGNLFALEEYYTLAKEKMTLPDNVAEPMVPPVADSLLQIMSPKSIDIFIKLYKLTFDRDFIDRKSFGLKYFCVSALQRLAYKNAEMVLSKLDLSRTQFDEEWNEAINDLQQTIKLDQIRASDTPCTYEEAITLVSAI